MVAKDAVKKTWVDRFLNRDSLQQTAAARYLVRGIIPHYSRYWCRAHQYGLQPDQPCNREGRCFPKPFFQGRGPVAPHQSGQEFYRVRPSGSGHHHDHGHRVL